MTVCWSFLFAIRLSFERIKSYLPARFFPTFIIFCAKKKALASFLPSHRPPNHPVRCALCMRMYRRRELTRRPYE